VGLLLVFLFVWNLMRTTDLNRIAAWLADGLLFASYATLVFLLVGGGGAETGAEDGRFQLSDDLRATGTAAVLLWAFVRLFAEGMSQKGNKRVVHFILAAVAFVAMFRTGTRGTLIQLAVVLPLLMTSPALATNPAAMVFRYACYMLALVAVGATIWVSLGAETKASYMAAYRFEKGEGTLDTRSQVWGLAMEKARERPWLGRGFGSSSFYAFTDEEYKELSSKELPYRTTVHNQYLEVFYEFGLVGLLVFAWLVVALCQGAVRIFSASGGRQAWLWRMLAVYAIGGAIEGLTHGGQISTGQPDVLRRWILYSCVLSFSMASFPMKRHLAALRAARPVARRLGPTEAPRSQQESGFSAQSAERQHLRTGQRRPSRSGVQRTSHRDHFSGSGAQS
jgi:O-antigen ligase